MGKPQTAIKKEQFKSPIGTGWLSMCLFTCYWGIYADVLGVVLLGFVVFGGLIFEVLSRIFFR